MKLYKHKKVKKFLVPLSIFLIAIFFCVSPKTVLPVYANPFDNISTEAILPKDNFGILKKINGAYYLIDKFGNIIDIVIPTPGVNLDKYIGKNILIKDNIFAGLAESPRRNNSSFLNTLRGYLSGFIHKSEIKFKNHPIKPPDDIHPLYGVEPEPIKPIPGPIKPPDDIHPLYGVEPIEPPDEIHPLYGVEPIEPPDDIHPLYGVEPGSALEKNMIIEQLRSEHNKLNSMGIKIVPEMGNGENPLLDIQRK